MFHVYNAKSRLPGGFPGFLLYGNILIQWISLPFVLGLIFGTLIGLFSEAPGIPFITADFLHIEKAAPGFWLILWRSFRFVLAALLLSTSFLGVFLLPVLSAFRGFIFACSIAFIFQAESFHGLLFACIALGLPALLGLPAFLIACSDSFCASKRLLAVFRQPIPEDSFLLPVRFRRYLLVFLLCSADALYSRMLLPVLIGILN